MAESWGEGGGAAHASSLVLRVNIFGVWVPRGIFGFRVPFSGFGFHGFRFRVVGIQQLFMGGGADVVAESGGDSGGAAYDERGGAS